MWNSCEVLVVYYFGESLGWSPDTMLAEQRVGGSADQPIQLKVQLTSKATGVCLAEHKEIGPFSL